MILQLLLGPTFWDTDLLTLQFSCFLCLVEQLEFLFYLSTASDELGRLKAELAVGLDSAVAELSERVLELLATEFESREFGF